MIGDRSVRGFTLIELSIVLVIIGVLAGSVIIGRDLLESSRVRVSIKDREMILAAVNVFKERYECTPGDCPNLTDFWADASLDGSDSFCGGAWWGSGAPLPPGKVCNGNGDRRIEGGFPTFGNAEVHGFWHQLALAGLFTKANYTGSRIRVGSTPYVVENGGWPFTARGGVNAPESPMGDNVCWSVLSTSNDPPQNPRQDTFEPESV
jgi:prepilin-type N-terminal cleavage/methylation domain-containing protein